MTLERVVFLPLFIVQYRKKACYTGITIEKCKKGQGATLCKSRSTFFHTEYLFGQTHCTTAIRAPGGSYNSHIPGRISAQSQVSTSCVCVFFLSAVESRFRVKVEVNTL